MNRTSTTSGSSSKASMVGSLGLLPVSLARASAETLAVLEVSLAKAGILALNRNTRGAPGFTEPRSQLMTLDAEGSEQPRGGSETSVASGSSAKRIATFVAVEVPALVTATR